MPTEDTSKTEFRGICIPHPATVDSSCIWESESSYDQAGPAAGVPADQSGSAMVLEATGAQTAGSTLRVRTEAGGFPGPNGARFIHRGADSGDWYGWLGPYSVSGYEYVASALYPSAITLQNDDILCFTASSTGVECWTYDAATNDWAFPATATVATHSTFPNLNAAYCDAVQLPSGRILCLHLVEDADNATIYSISVSFSDDNGATWAVWSEFAVSDTGRLDTDLNVPYRLRCAYNEATGEIMALIWAQDVGATHPNILLQYASSDLGASFSYVGSIDGTDTDDQSITGDVVVVDGVFVVVSDNPSSNAGVNGSEAFRLASAFEGLPAGGAGETFAVSNRDVLTGTGTVQAEQMAAACVDGAGVIWYLSTNASAAVANYTMFRSSDGGVSWTEQKGGTLTSGYGSVYQPGVSTVQLVYPSMVWQRERAVVLCNHDSPTTSLDDGNLTAIYLGGYSTVTYPLRDTTGAGGGIGRKVTAQAGWGANWLPFELPNNDGWSTATSGTASGSISTGALSISTTGAGFLQYQRSFTGSETRMRVHGVVRATSGQADAWLTYDDGTTQLQVEIAVTPTAITLVNQPTGANATLDTDSHGGGYVEYICEVGATYCVLWWRDYDSSEAKSWTKQTGTPTTIGTADGTGQIQFGCRGATDDAASWLLFAYSVSGDCGKTMESWANPDDLLGREYPAGAGRSVYVDDGVSIYAVDGPTGGAEAWNIDTRYEHPIERIIPGTSPSPRIGWRSSSTTAGMSIALRLDADTDQDNYGGEISCLYLDGVNFRQFQIQRYNGGAWGDEVTVNNYDTFTGSRSGNVVAPTGSGTPSGGIYVQHGELVGGYVDFGSGDVRPIVANSEGVLEAGSPSTPHLRCRIYCGDIDGTEATSGTFAVWWPRVAVIWAPGNHQAVRIQINDDASPVAPPEGYYKIGVMHYGPVAYFGRDYSFGRVVTTAPNTEIMETRAGHRRTRVDGPARRSVSVSFPAIDVTQYTGDSAGPDVIETHANIAEAFAVPDEPVRLPGMIEYLRGPHRPVVYLPYVPKLSISGGLSAVHNWQRARGAIYGRVTSPVSLSSVAGSEEVDEVLSIASLTIEGEV